MRGERSGTVLAATVIRVAPPDVPTPYAVAVVEWPDGRELVRFDGERETWPRVGDDVTEGEARSA